MPEAMPLAWNNAEVNDDVAVPVEGVAVAVDVDVDGDVTDDIELAIAVYLQSCIGAFSCTLKTYCRSGGTPVISLSRQVAAAHPARSAVLPFQAPRNVQAGFELPQAHPPASRSAGGERLHSFRQRWPPPPPVRPSQAVRRFFADSRKGLRLPSAPLSPSRASIGLRGDAGGSLNERLRDGSKDLFGLQNVLGGQFRASHSQPAGYEAVEVA